MRILISDGRPSDEPHDVVVLPGNIAGSPIKAILAATAVFLRPVVLVGGSDEWEGGKFERKLADGRRQAKKRPGMHFLEAQIAIIADVRFIGATTPSALIGAALLNPPFRGPTVAVTHAAPAEAISMFQPDVWIYGDGLEADAVVGRTRLVRRSMLVIDVEQA